MNENTNFQEFIKSLEGRRAAYHIFTQEKIPARLMIALEGFKSRKKIIKIDDGLSIKKISQARRTKFFQRARGIDMSEWTAKNNQYFLFYDFDAARVDFNGIAQIFH